MMKENGAAIAEYFGNSHDPRKTNKRHKLSDIIVITISAVICGADTWKQAEEFGCAKTDWLKRKIVLTELFTGTNFL